MNATLSRLLLLVHGQPDTMETPLPGFWGRSGGGSIDTLRGYSGGCHQGRKACDCETELACDIPPDAERVIQPPPPLSDDMRARFKRRALYLSVLGFGALAGLLEAFGANPFDRTLP